MVLQGDLYRPMEEAFRSGTLLSRISLGGLSGIREDYILRGVESLSLD